MGRSAALLVTAVIVTDYSNLAAIGFGLTASMIVASLMVRVGEELMFRGIGVTVFRRNGFSEGRVALWSSVIFGAVHFSSIFVEGPNAIGQVAVVSVTGYFFYLCRRRSGGLLLPIICHGAWDFALFSGRAGPDPDTYPPALLAVATNIVLAVVLLARRHKIEPQTASA